MPKSQKPQYVAPASMLNAEGKLTAVPKGWNPSYRSLAMGAFASPEVYYQYRAWKEEAKLQGRLEALQTRAELYKARKNASPLELTRLKLAAAQARVDKYARRLEALEAAEGTEAEAEG